MNVISPIILDSSGSVLRRIDPVDVSLDLQLQPLSSAEIELKPGDTIPERSLVAVYTEHGLAGIFRSRPQRDRYGERSSRVSLVHGACELNDYLTTKGGDQQQDPANTAIAYIMQFYLGTHWRLGTVSATSSVVYQLNGSGVLDAITEIMEQLPGYMLVFDQSVTPWTLNVLPRPETVSAEGRLSRNISSVEISRDDSSLCTRVYYGENDLFVEDAAAIQKYGVIEYRISDSGLTNSQLAAIAQAYLDNHKASKLSVSISAIDFYNATGEPLDRIALGSKYRLAIPDAETEENRVIEAIICSIHYDSVRSRNPQITLASDPDTIITFLKKQRRTGGSARQIAKEEAQKQYEHIVDETDAYRKEIYRVNGVVYDSNGNIVYQTDPVTGEYILDNAGNKIPVYNPESNGSISGQIIQSAQRMATIIKQSGTVTEVFDKTKPYVIGDCVLYPDANGNPYRFTKDHDANVDWKGTGENGDVEPLGTLQSQIDQNVDYTASIYGTVTDLGGDVRQIKGSTIWQNETAIANIIGTVEIDKDGNLKIKDGKGLYVTGDSTINGFIKDNQMTAGYLIKKINGDETEAAVKADKIYLDADKTVKVGEALFITTGGAFWVKRNATFGNRAGEFVTINGGTVNAPTIQVNSGGSLQFSPGSQSGTAISINHTTAASLITDVHIKGPSENDNYYTLEYKKIGTGADTWNPTTVKIPVSATSGLTDANVANNILTLTKSDGTTVNFSKATSVTGEWGSRATPESSPVPNGTLYVKATQTNRNTTTGQDETTTVSSMDIHLHNAGHWGSASTTGEDVNTYYYRVTASQGNSGSMSETGLSFNIDAGGRYTAGQDSVVSTFDTPASVPSSVTPTDLLKGTVRRYHVTKDGTDVVDTYFRVPNYSATLTPTSTSGTKTTLSDGVYGLYVTKDGSAEQTPIAYYEVSGGTVASGEITDILTRDGKVTYNSTSEMISVLLRATGTGITNSPYDDSVSLSVSASGVTLTKGNLTNTSTDTHNHIYAGRYTVNGSGGGLFKVENIDTISASVSPLPINLQLTQPYSTPFTWNNSTYKYTYTVKSGLQVDGSNVLSYETDDAVFDPYNAIQHGFDVCHDSISLSAVTQTLAAGDSITIYPKAKSDVSAASASNIVSAGITITAASGGSGGTRTARQLLTPSGEDTITLAATDTETSSHNLVAYYTSGTDTTTLPIKIDAKEVYDAGVTAGLGGVVNVVKQPWASNTCEFRPSAGNGSSASVTITAEATKVAPSSATATGEIVLKDGSTQITTMNLYLRPKTVDGQSYVVLTDSSSIITMGNILAKYSASGGGSESSVYSIVQNGTITYSSDYQTAFVPVAAKDENGTTLLSSSIAADITDAWENGYTEGLTAGSGMEVQDTKDIRSNPITSNNSDIRIDPDGSALAMGHVRLAVNVPQEITDAALYRSNDSVSTYNTWSGYTIDQLTTKYAQLRIAQANGTNAYVKIDASDVYERGVAAGADTAGYRLTTVELAGSPNYFRQIAVPTGTTTVNAVTGSGALYQVNSNGSLYLCSVEVSRTVQGYLYQNNGSGFERVPGTGNGSWFYVDGNVTRLMKASNLKVASASTTQYTVATGSRQAYVTDSSGTIVLYTKGSTVSDTYYIKTN